MPISAIHTRKKVKWCNPFIGPHEERLLEAGNELNQRYISSKTHNVCAF
jgi:hypothetical protein